MFSKEVTLGKTRLDTFAVYCERMFQVQPCVASDPYRWSGCLKIYAAYLLYKRPCIVHLMDTLLNRMFLKHYDLQSDILPIRLLYEGSSHYTVL